MDSHFWCNFVFLTINIVRSKGHILIKEQADGIVYVEKAYYFIIGTKNHTHPYDGFPPTRSRVFLIAFRLFLYISTYGTTSHLFFFFIVSKSRQTFMGVTQSGDI